MIIVFLLVIGLCLGSFVNALAWRLHEGRNWVSERSECIHCHHQLNWKDLVPVFSWVLLKGKCRYCRKPIDDSPITELVTALAFVGSYIYWPYTLTGLLSWSLFVLWLFILVGFMAMIVSDLKWMTLPNKLTYTFVAVGAVNTIILSIFLKDSGVITGALGGVLSVAGLFWVIFQVSGGKWIGGGDVKLGVLLGMLAGGVFKGLLLVFVASAIGSIIAIPLLIAKKKQLTNKIPFGPYLIMATVVVYLFGQQIIDWYQNLFLV